MVMSLPEFDQLNMHKDQCKQRLAMTMAGKAAEIIKWGEDSVSNGPSGDIQQASALARAMVLRWGMSDKVGNIDYAEAHAGYQGNTGGFSVSAETKTMIETEVKRLIDDGYATARKIILEKAEEFERLAKGLLEHETLTGDEIKRIVAGLPLTEDKGSEPPAQSGGGGSATVVSIPKTRARKPKANPEPEPLI
jgi:cell division protease FtsH